VSSVRFKAYRAVREGKTRGKANNEVKVGEAEIGPLTVMYIELSPSGKQEFPESGTPIVIIFAFFCCFGLFVCCCGCLRFCVSFLAPVDFSGVLSVLIFLSSRMTDIPAFELIPKCAG